MDSSTSILIPMLVRPGIHLRILDESSIALAALQRHLKAKGIQVDVAWNSKKYEKEYPEENYWSRFARMRQSAIEQYLRPEHDWVLWIDADITTYPETLFEQLHPDDELAIVSPLVTVGNSEVNYDTAGTRPNFESRSDQKAPAAGVYEMFSVGGCVLVPADVHRAVEFEAQADDDATSNTEWTSLCVGARELGFRVLWNTGVVVRHANLPDYGEQWH